MRKTLHWPVTMWNRKTPDAAYDPLNDYFVFEFCFERRYLRHVSLERDILLELLLRYTPQVRVVAPSCQPAVGTRSESRSTHVVIPAV